MGNHPTPKIYHLYAHVLQQQQRQQNQSSSSSSFSSSATINVYNDLLLLEPNFWYLEKCARGFSSSSSSRRGDDPEESEEIDEDCDEENEEYSSDEDDEDASKAAFKKLFGMMRESASSANDDGGATTAATTRKAHSSLSSSSSFKILKCSPCAMAKFSRTILFSKLDEAETVPHTNVMQSTRVENALKTLRGVVQALAKQSRKASGVDIVHWMTIVGTTNSANDNDNTSSLSNSKNDMITSAMTTTSVSTSAREFAMLPSVDASNRFFNALIQKCCDVLKSDVSHPKCKLEALKLLASLAKCKEDVGSSCLFAYLVSDQKNGDAIFDAIVNNVLKNDILARNTLWQNACYVLALLMSWNEGQNRVAARTARATDLEAGAMLRAVSFLMTRSGRFDDDRSNDRDSSSSRGRNGSRNKKTAASNATQATATTTAANFLTSGWMHVTKALGFVEEKLNGVSGALGTQTKMFPNSDIDVCGALCIARDAQFMNAQSLLITENEQVQSEGENGKPSSSLPTIAHILDDDAALIGVALMHGVMSNCVALRLPRAWIKQTSLNISETLHGVALGDHWRDALGSILVFAAALAREREIEKKRTSSSIANNIRRIVGGADTKRSASSSEAAGEARRKALATSVLSCFQRLVDDSASLEFLCSLSCLDCARPVPGSAASSYMSPLSLTTSSSLSNSNGTGNADTHFISNLASSKGLLNARVKLNRPFIAAMLETCSEITKFGEYFGADVTSRAVYISHQIVSVKAANRSFVCANVPSTEEGGRRRGEDEHERENDDDIDNGTFKATGEGSASLRANWSRTFEAIAVALELCSKAHAAEASTPPAVVAKKMNGATSPKREKQRNAGRANEDKASNSSSLDEFKATHSAVAAQLVNLVNLFLAKPESSCDSIADVAELVETLVALCPKLTPLLNVVGQPTYGELRMQSIAFVYNALKSVNKTATNSSSTKPNESTGNSKNVTVRSVAEREINDGSMTRNVPVKDNLTAAFALRSGVVAGVGAFPAAKRGPDEREMVTTTTTTRKKDYFSGTTTSGGENAAVTRALLRSVSL
jgi:hypothetical protein